MSLTSDEEAIRQTIEEACTKLSALREQFGEGELPPPVAHVERAIRAHLDAAQSLLNES